MIIFDFFISRRKKLAVVERPFIGRWGLALVAVAVAVAVVERWPL